MDGNQLIQTPEFTLNLATQYSAAVGDGELTLRGELAFQDRIYFTQFNERIVSRAPNTTFNAFLTYELGNWDFSIYGRNLSNETIIANSLVNSALLGLPTTGTLYPPRTYGVRVGYSF